VAAFVKAADDLIYDNSYDSAAGQHYKVKTDDPRCVAARAVELLEGFREQFERDWSGRLEMRPYEGVSRAYLFYSRFKYKQLLEGGGKAISSVVGHYMPYLDIVALHTDTVGLPDTPDVLVHEATHQLMQQRLYGDEVSPMPWISEGMAGYYGHMLREKTGAYVPTRTGPKNVALFKEGDSGGPGLGRQRARDYVRLLKSGEAAPLDQMIRMQEMGHFYGPGAHERYTASWLLTRFLMTADEGAHRDRFTKYLAREIREDTTPEDFYREIGMTPEQLQAAFTTWAKKSA
jgi:hypothetical protein